MLRAVIVVLYTCIAGGFTHDGTSAGDIVGLTLLGVVALVVVLLADWVNEAPRKGDDR